VVDSRNAILHQGLAEIQQMPKFHSGQAELGSHLLLVSWMDLFNGLEFHNHLPLDNQRADLVLVHLRGSVTP
jgi:hypothetical protein